MNKICGNCHYYANSLMHGPWCTKNRKEVSYLQSAFDCWTEPGTAPAEEMQMKVCSRCGRELPITNFGRHSRTKDGYQPCCRECQSEMNKGHKKRQPFENNEAPAKPELPEPIPEGMKRCCHCKQILPVSEFNKAAGAKDGLQSACRSCISELNKEYSKTRPKRRKDPSERKTPGPKAAHPAYVDEATGVTMRWCGHCKQYKPESEFYSDRSNKSGFATSCKACGVIKEKERRRKKREALKAEEAKVVAEAEKDFQIPAIPTLYDATDDQLVEELKRRGYTGNIIRKTSFIF